MSGMSQANCMEAQLRLFQTDDGGKTQSIRHGYRGGMLVFPEWKGTWTDGGARLSIGAAVRLLDRAELCPGESAIVRFYFWAPEGLEEIDVSPGVTFGLWEGRFVGEGTIVTTFPEPWPTYNEE
jgi:hypothetical protein